MGAPWPFGQARWNALAAALAAPVPDDLPDDAPMSPEDEERAYALASAPSQGSLF